MIGTLIFLVDTGTIKKNLPAPVVETIKLVHYLLPTMKRTK